MQHTFYTAEDLPRLARKRKAWLAAAIAVAALIIGTVAILLARTNAFNERVMRYTAEAIAVVSGWVLVLLLMNVFALKKDRKHVHVMLEGPGSEVSGVIRSPGKPQRIPGGIDFCPVTLVSGEGEKHLRVSLKNSKRLPADGVRVRAVTVHGFITAWEEEK